MAGSTLWQLHDTSSKAQLTLPVCCILLGTVGLFSWALRYREAWAPTSLITSTVSANTALRPRTGCFKRSPVPVGISQEEQGAVRQQCPPVLALSLRGRPGEGPRRQLSPTDVGTRFPPTEDLTPFSMVCGLVHARLEQSLPPPKHSLRTAWC